MMCLHEKHIKQYSIVDLKLLVVQEVTHLPAVFTEISAIWVLYCFFPTPQKMKSIRKGSEPAKFNTQKCF